MNDYWSHSRSVSLKHLKVFQGKPFGKLLSFFSVNHSLIFVERSHPYDANPLIVNLFQFPKIVFNIFESRYLRNIEKKDQCLMFSIFEFERFITCFLKFSVNLSRFMFYWCIFFDHFNEFINANVCFLTVNHNAKLILVCLVIHFYVLLFLH